MGRLRHRLDLPPITPRPSLPKRPYDALLGHFKKNLPVSSTVSYTTAAAELDGREPLNAPTTKELQALCTTHLHVPAALRHVLAGVHAVTTDPEHTALLQKPREGEKLMAAIMCAVTILTIELLSPKRGSILVGAKKWERRVGFPQKKRMVMEALVKVRGEETPPVDRAMVDDWIKRLSGQGFRKWKWMEEIPDARGVGQVEDEDEEEDDDDDGDGDGDRDGVGDEEEEGEERKEEAERDRDGEEKVAAKGTEKDVHVRKAKGNVQKAQRGKMSLTKRKKPVEKPVKQPTKRARTRADMDAAGGGGRMLQDRVDYLSERRMKAFKVWKAEILEECARIEASQRS
jgi:hypothetical protein